MRYNYLPSPIKNKTKKKSFFFIMYLKNKYASSKIAMLLNKILFIKQRDPIKYPLLPKEFQRDSNCVLILIEKFKKDKKNIK